MWIKCYVCLEKMVSGTCRSYNGKRYKCAEKGTEKRGDLIFGSSFDKKTIKNLFKKQSLQISSKNMEFDAKGVPNWSQNRCPKSSKINATNDKKKHQEIITHNKSWFSE